MSRVEKLEKEVASLSTDEYRQFREWFLERNWAEWDRQIVEDSASGKIDFLLKEADEEKRQGRLRSL